MSVMISVASGFQYSVNIGYDFCSDEKLKNFIPTKSSIHLLEETLLSINPSSTDRAKVLIGAYGRGKSHILLMILSILIKRDLALFEKMMPIVYKMPTLMQYINNYYEGNEKILPVIISGSNASINQAFLLALQRTLSEYNLSDVMPETNYIAAVAVINRWKNDFPNTYERFKELIDKPVDRFIEELQNYDLSTYITFEQIYPQLTAGSIFNPFLGFDVVELYENVARGLYRKGYTGIYVVYDEFSKYLEANITDASVTDTKMLQDFAEKCNRSGKLQMHLMLISHKEISNYIDGLPKQKVDGWRGVSERFRHIHMSNNFSQTYEIISSVIRKDPTLWDPFCKHYKDIFLSLEQRYQIHSVFSDEKNDSHLAIYGCYPMHPISTFILPRLSERVAQNERTLFTFLSAEGASTLPAFLRDYEDTEFRVITPDILYDYFEPLFRKEIYTSKIHENYILTNTILGKLPESGLSSKIIKTISIIYILEQFEKLKPTFEEIIGIYSFSYDVAIIEQAIADLIDKEYVLYLKKSNGYLRLKKTSGVDVWQNVHNLVASQSSMNMIKSTLNEVNIDNYMYPSRYNDEREMTRYFSFSFIDGREVAAGIDWNIKSERVHADGVIYGIVPSSEDEIGKLIQTIKETSLGQKSYVFVITKRFKEIESAIREYNAVCYLREHAIDDQVLFEEYEVIYEDLHELINTFISSYTHPEKYMSVYIHNGEEKYVFRKATLTELLSNICDNIYGLTPVINNEAINRNEITNIASNSRNKIVAALLRNDLEPNLGLSGNGQEVSIMRSTLIRTGVWNEQDNIHSVNLRPSDMLMSNMLSVIETFILEAYGSNKVKFSELYKKLTSPEHNIGLRRGLIPIYIAVVIHKYKKSIIISDRFGQVQTSADVLLQINYDPESFSLTYLDWNTEKAKYVQRLSEIFSLYVNDAERQTSSYDYVASAIHRWFYSLPKYSKNCKKFPDSITSHIKNFEISKLLRQNLGSYELLFSKIPNFFDSVDATVDVAERLRIVKSCYDEMIGTLLIDVINKVKTLFAPIKNNETVLQMSLATITYEWCNSLDDKVFEQLFSDGTDNFLHLMKYAADDESAFVRRLAEITTGLRIEDWDDNTQEKLINRLKGYKQTAEDFRSRSTESIDIDSCNYLVVFSGDNGEATTKRFKRIEVSARGKLLFNQITSALESMGQSISEQEKRQILLEVVRSLC